MGYKHFGEIGDIWKHFPLCDVVKIENIQTYVETNSAYFDYNLENTKEQAYGIGHFINKSKTNNRLQQTTYYKLIELMYEKNKYLGSCGQVMSLLKRKVNRYVFFDLDVQAIESMKNAVQRNGLADIVDIRNSDSITGLINLIPELDINTFVHIDPYQINSPNENGDTYIDGFIEASKKGVKCFLWYGFTTLKEKRDLNRVILDSLNRLDDISLSCHELILKEIQEDNVKANPGILGCGILTSNLSEKSKKLISEFSGLMVEIYKNVEYKNISGALYGEMIILKVAQ